jgi:hypothetical protein
LREVLKMAVVVERLPEERANREKGKGERERKPTSPTWRLTQAETTTTGQSRDNHAVAGRPYLYVQYSHTLFFV